MAVINKESANFPSPAWHGNILIEREKQGEEFIDWDSVKGKI